MWIRATHFLDTPIQFFLFAIALMLGGPVWAAGSGIPEQRYRLGPNDVIRIEVFGEEDLTVEGKIDGNGRINFPLLGGIEVEGQRIEEVRDAVTTKLAEGYVREPKVTVTIVRYRNFYVRGEVKTPGAYPYEEGLTLHKAISIAGGFTDKASEGRTKVLRLVNGHEQSIHVQLEDLVLPGDIIVIPRRFF